MKFPIQPCYLFSFCSLHILTFILGLLCFPFRPFVLLSWTLSQFTWTCFGLSYMSLCHFVTHHLLICPLVLRCFSLSLRLPFMSLLSYVSPAFTFVPHFRSGVSCRTLCASSLCIRTLCSPVFKGPACICCTLGLILLYFTVSLLHSSLSRVHLSLSPTQTLSVL